MATQNWMNVEMDKDPDVMIIDCGYVTKESARNHADAIFDLGISKRNLTWGPSTSDLRVHVSIPKTKQKMVKESLPISDKKTWFGATHSWL